MERSAIREMRASWSHKSRISLRSIRATNWSTSRLQGEKHRKRRDILRINHLLDRRLGHRCGATSVIDLPLISMRR
jgi:hypothetical protein